MSSYRQQSSQIAWSSSPVDVIMTNAIMLNNAFDEYFDYKFRKIISEKNSNCYYVMYVDYVRLLDFSNAYSALLGSLRSCFSWRRLFMAICIDGPKSFLKGRIMQLFPNAYQKIKNAQFIYSVKKNISLFFKFRNRYVARKP